MKIAEICCGSFYDAKQAAAGGAVRIELNSALHMGGLTPTVSALRLIKEHTSLRVIAMVRPRGGGFCYSEADFAQMKAECEELAANGADGIAFGCLNGDASLNMDQNRAILEIIKRYGKEAVFHRAFDCCRNPFGTVEALIGLGVDRILTSGQKPRAIEGAELIRELAERYGGEIQFLAGSGVNSSNARELMEKTGISQVHSSCKTWLSDRTTAANGVSYAYAPAPNELMYDVVSKELVERLIRSIGE